MSRPHQEAAEIVKRVIRMGAFYEISLPGNLLKDIQYYMHTMTSRLGQIPCMRRYDHSTDWQCLNGTRLFPVQPRLGPMDLHGDKMAAPWYRSIDHRPAAILCFIRPNKINVVFPVTCPQNLWVGRYGNFLYKFDACTCTRMQYQASMCINMCTYVQCLQIHFKQIWSWNQFLCMWVIQPGWGMICDGVNCYICKCTIYYPWL